MKNQRGKEEQLENQIMLPEEYEYVVDELTEAVNNGFVSFLNPETMEVDQVSDEGYYGISEMAFDEQNEDMVDEYGLSYQKWDSYIKLEPFDRDDLLDVINEFIDVLKNEDLKTQLENFTDKEELIDNFEEIAERTGNLESWLDFKRHEVENYVRSQILSTLELSLSTADSLAQYIA